jgi:hypothetical protein
MLTPYQLQRQTRLAQPYVEDLPEARAIDNLILLFDVVETLELTVPQMTTIFGATALTYVTELAYGAPEGKPAVAPAGALAGA